MTPEQLGASLALITSQAAGLRAAGVAAVEIAGDRVVIRFAPPFGAVAPPEAFEEQAIADEPIVEPDPDPLDDPETYGGEVPGFTLEDDE